MDNIKSEQVFVASGMGDEAAGGADGQEETYILVSERRE